MRVPLAQSTTRSAARASADLGVARAQLGGQARQARAEGEDLDAAPRADHRVQVEQQRAGVGLHRARHVAQHDELARRLRAPAKAPAHRVAAGGDRVARQARACRGRARAGARAAGASAARGRSVTIAAMSARAAASSSGVMAAKSLWRRTSCALWPMLSGSPSAGAASRPRARVAAHRAWRPCACARGSISRRAGARPARRRNQASKARSKGSRSSRRATSVVRSVQ